LGLVTVRRQLVGGVLGRGVAVFLCCTVLGVGASAWRAQLGRGWLNPDERGELLGGPHPVSANSLLAWCSVVRSSVFVVTEPIAQEAGDQQLGVAQVGVAGD
jgi:hypothetical protein